jgi:hypothetical protein
MGCAGAPSVSPHATAIAAAPPVEDAIAPPSPARWAFYDRLGTLFDQAGHGVSGLRPEPAIVDGVRVVVEAGRIVASARHAERFSGFRSVPERLGGGFVLWSEDRVYRAQEFLGEPSPIADVGAAGGARPWLATILLRTSAGILEVDPGAPARPLRRAAYPGLADALAVDARRGVRLDTLGRASVTTDGGASWTDVLATRGLRVLSLGEGPAGEVVLNVAQGKPLVLGASGDLAPPADPVPDARAPAFSIASLRPASSRALPGEILAHAVAGGALLPGGRILVAREGGARVLALETGLPLDDADLPGVDARVSRCQAAPAGLPAAVLACVGEGGAAVLDLEGSLARPALEMTFPAGGGGFAGGPHGRLAYDGRCGPEPPSSTDLGPANKPAESTDEAAATPPAPEPAGPAELPPDDDARACVRAATAHWVERRLGGDDARHLYRWIPGDDATVTALVLAGSKGPGDGGVSVPGSTVSASGEGLRVIRVDPEDPALSGGVFPAVLPPQKETPVRTVDVDFWQDDDGVIRGWLVLPAQGEDRVSAPPSAQGPAHRIIPVATRRGGRRAGVRIDAEGHVTVLPLPAGTIQVVTGGRFALAMTGGDPPPGASGDAVRPRPRAWFETVDGGATWTPAVGPPVGALEPPDENATSACSPIGCAWASGVVRLGWGGPAPRSDPELALTPAASSRPRASDPASILCHLDGDPPWAHATRPAAPAPKPRAARPPARKPGASSRPVALSLAHVWSPGSTPALGALHEHAWSAEVLPPFQPGEGPRRLSASDRALHGNQGSVVPVLGTKGAVDLLLLVDKRRLRAGGGAASFLPFAVPGRLAVAADTSDGALLTFDADRGTLWLSRGEATSAVVHLARVADPSARTRLTLAQRLSGSGGLALAGYSVATGELFAGDLDLGRAEVGPLVALGRIDDLADPSACSAATHRLLVELPARLRIVGPAGQAFDEAVTVQAVLAAGPNRTCVEALEAVVRRGDSIVLRARLGSGASASLWTPETRVRGRCTIEKRRPAVTMEDPRRVPQAPPGLP